MPESGPVIPTVCSGPRGQKGLALVLVLWVISLLTVMALGVSSTGRTELELMRGQIDAVRFRALADAGVNFAAMKMLAATDEYPWWPDGIPQVWRFGGADLQIAVSDEGGRINLNKASFEQLLGLFQAIGLSDADSEALADAIVDWRDTDDLHRASGAEDKDYWGQERAFGSKDGPFDSVEELQQVYGMSREIFALVAPALTLHSSGARINRTYASELVLAAIGVGPEELEVIMEERELRAAEEDPAVPVSRGGPVYRIRVGAALDTRKVNTEFLIRTGGGSGEVTFGGSAVFGSGKPFDIIWRDYAPPDAAGAGGGAGALAE